MNTTLARIIGSTVALGTVSAIGLSQLGASPATIRIRPAGVVEDVSGPCDEAEHAGDPRCDATATRPERARDDRAREIGEDVSGPCDEAEHADDPRCTGVTVPDADDDDDAPGDDDEAGDISGPCDEAEHADDPRCTGTVVDDGDNSGPGSDNSGPGSDDSGSDDDSGGHGGDDRSGSNSGKG